MALRLFVRCVLRSRCPCCGEGRIFAGWLRLHEHCSHCGLRYDQWVGEWITPTYLASTLGMLVGFALMAWVLMRGDASAASELGVAGAAAGTALLALRPSKTGWLAFLYWVGAVEVSARTRARLRWDEEADEATDAARLRAADQRARTVRARAAPALTTRRFVSLRSLLFPRVGRPPRPRPGGSPRSRRGRRDTGAR